MPESPSKLPVLHASAAPAQKIAEPTPVDLLPNDMMRAYVEEYCTGGQSGKRFNATRAAEVAGYAEPAAQSHRLKSRDDIKAAVNWRLNQLVIGNEEIVARLNALATTDLGEAVDTTNPSSPRYNIQFIKDNPHLVKSFKLDSNGNPVFEFHDPHAALKDLMKVRGMGKEGLEISGPGGGAVPVQLQVNFLKPRSED